MSYYEEISLDKRTSDVVYVKLLVSGRFLVFLAYELLYSLRTGIKLAEEDTTGRKLRCSIGRTCRPW
jgi:hypothetical protein